MSFDTFWLASKVSTPDLIRLAWNSGIATARSCAQRLKVVAANGFVPAVVDNAYSPVGLHSFSAAAAWGNSGTVWWAGVASQAGPCRRTT